MSLPLSAGGTHETIIDVYLGSSAGMTEAGAVAGVPDPMAHGPPIEAVVILLSWSLVAWTRMS